MRFTTSSFLVFALVIPLALSSVDAQVRSLPSVEGSLAERSVHREFSEMYNRFDDPFTRAGDGWEVKSLNSAAKNLLLRKEVFGYLPYWFRSRWNQIDYSLVSTIAYFSGEVEVDGSITQTRGWPSFPGDPNASSDVVNMINMAHANGVRVVLCLTSFTSNDIHTIVSTPSLRTAVIQRALALVEAGNAEGVNINFENIQTASRDFVTQFMRELADTFHTRRPGSQVSCAPTDYDTRQGDWDITALAPFIDLFFFQGYGYAYGGSPVSGPVGLLPNTAFWGTTNITTFMNFVQARIDTSKIVLGLPHFGYRWPTMTGDPKAPTQAAGVPFYYPDALVVIATRGRQWDATALNPWYRYQDVGQWYQGWYDDPESMGYKYQFALSRNLHGVGMWALGMDGANHDIWDVLRYYFADSSVVLLAPGAPTLATVRDSSDLFEGRAYVRWFSNVEPYLGGYRLYMSTSPFSFPSTPVLDETVLDKNSNSTIVPGLAFDSTYYFRLIAVDSSRTRLSDTSDTYGMRIGSGPRYLVVDGFDRISGSYLVPHHVFNASYGGPIAASNRRFDSADNDALINGILTMDGYAGVIWFLGDESTADRTFNVTEQALVQNYLTTGGKLFTSGSEIGWDVGRSASPNYNPTFYNGYLKATYVGDAATGSAFTGVTGSIFNGISGSFGQTYPEDFPDYIGVAGGSTVALTYNASQNAAIQYEGLFGSGGVPGRLVNVGFGFETIASSTTRNALMARVLEFFERPLHVAPSSGLPSEFLLDQNYPNPFNPTTTIDYHVATSTHITLSIHDILGRMVATLVNEQKTPGVYRAQFDASGLASGVYVYRLQWGSNSLSRKMMVVR